MEETLKLINYSPVFVLVVMQDTGCHIHFPDSNRGATNEKSNQVCFKYDYEFLLNCKRHIQLMLDIQ